MILFQNSIGGKWKAIYALALMTWDLPATVYAQPLNTPHETPFSTKYLPELSSSIQDRFIISERDLSSDVLSNPRLARSLQQNVTDGSDGNGNGLLLRSSSYKINGTGGFPISALPIMFSDLSDLLNRTRTDLQTRSGVISTSSYYVNTANWLFWVNIADATLHYGAIKAVVSHFTRLSSATAAPHDIVSTRVGVVFNKSTPVADVTILPYHPILDSSDIPFEQFGNQDPSTSQTNELLQITPFGSSNAHRVVNETTALAPYQKYGSVIEQKNLWTRDIGTEMLVPIAQTVYQMGVRLWHDPVHGIPVQVKVWAIKSVCLVGFYLSMSEAVRVLRTPSPNIQTDPIPVIADDFESKLILDTGYYQVGRLMGRLVIRSMRTPSMKTPTTGFGSPTSMSVKIYLGLIQALLAPLQHMNSQDEAWAMEGEVYGPGNAGDPGNGTVERAEAEVLAKWQISMRDHTEL